MFINDVQRIQLRYPLTALLGDDNSPTKSISSASRKISLPGYYGNVAMAVTFILNDD